MNWSNDTMDALHEWLGPDTFHTGHPNDDRNFYVFIGNVWKETHQLWDEAAIRDFLRYEIKELHPESPSDLIEKVIERARSNGTLILDFLCGLKHTRKLNTLIPIQGE